MPRYRSSRSGHVSCVELQEDCGDVHFRNPSGVAALVRRQQENGATEVEESLFLDEPFEDAMMYAYKVVMCPKQAAHNWNFCPFAHPGEHACRRDPRIFPYSATKCREKRRGRVCVQGDQCPFSHNVFESWLHPRRYRTMICHFGAACERTVCFFAHMPDELRSPEGMGSDELEEIERMAREFTDDCQRAQASPSLSPTSGLSHPSAVNGHRDPLALDNTAHERVHEIGTTPSSSNAAGRGLYGDHLAVVQKRTPMPFSHPRQSLPLPPNTSTNMILPSALQQAHAKQALLSSCGLGAAECMAPGSLEKADVLELLALLAAREAPAFNAGYTDLNTPHSAFSHPSFLGARTGLQEGPLDWNRSASGASRTSWDSQMSTQSSLSASDWLAAASWSPGGELQDIRARASLVSNRTAAETRSQVLQPANSAAMALAIQRAFHMQ